MKPSDSQKAAAKALDKIAPGNVTHTMLSVPADIASSAINLARRYLPPKMYNAMANMLQVRKRELLAYQEMLKLTGELVRKHGFNTPDGVKDFRVGQDLVHGEYWGKSFQEFIDSAPASENFKAFLKEIRPHMIRLWEIANETTLDDAFPHPDQATNLKFRDLYLPAVSENMASKFMYLLPEINTFGDVAAKLENIGFIRFSQTQGVGRASFLEIYPYYYRKMIFGNRRGGSNRGFNRLKKDVSKFLRTQKNLDAGATKVLLNLTSRLAGEARASVDIMGGRTTLKAAAKAEELWSKFKGEGLERLAEIEQTRDGLADVTVKLGNHLRKIEKQKSRKRALKAVREHMVNGEKLPEKYGPETTAYKRAVKDIEEIERLGNQQQVTASKLNDLLNETHVMRSVLEFMGGRPVNALADTAFKVFLFNALAFKLGTHSLQGLIDITQGVWASGLNFDAADKMKIIGEVGVTAGKKFATDIKSVLSGEYEMFNPEKFSRYSEQLVSGSVRSDGTFTDAVADIADYLIVDSHYHQRPVMHSSKGSGWKATMGQALDTGLESGLAMLSAWDHAMSEVLVRYSDVAFREAYYRRLESGEGMDGLAAELSKKIGKSYPQLAATIDNLAKDASTANDARNRFAEFAAQDIFVGIGAEWAPAWAAGMKGESTSGLGRFYASWATKFLRHPVHKVTDALRDPEVAAKYIGTSVLLYLLFAATMGEEEADRSIGWMAGGQELDAVYQVLTNKKQFGGRGAADKVGMMVVPGKPIIDTVMEDGAGGLAERTFGIPTYGRK